MIAVQLHGRGTVVTGHGQVGTVECRDGGPVLASGVQHRGAQLLGEQGPGGVVDEDRVHQSRVDARHQVPESTQFGPLTGRVPVDDLDIRCHLLVEHFLGTPVVLRPDDQDER